MIKFEDRATVGETKQLDSGYLVATSRVARTGVQYYLASELGDIAKDAGFADSDVVSVYRHPDEVFSKDSLASITRLPITVNHPQDDVTAENWSQLSVGDVGDSYTTDSEWIIVNPMIKDAAAISAARSTHKEISMGYSAEIVKARDGVDADFEQKNIRYNHLALVPKGRAGDKARIGDTWGAIPVKQGEKPKPASKQEDTMSDALKTVVLGDKAVQVAVADVAAIEQFKKDSVQALADSKAKHDSAIAAKDEEIGKLKVELKTAQDAANVDVDKLVADRAALVDAVRAIDASIDCNGKKDADLRKAAVVAKLGDASIQGASDAEINGMFKVLAKSTNPVADAIGSGLQNFGDASKAASDALAKANADINSWRNQEGK